MTDVDDDRDGLPRGYAITDPYAPQYGPVTPDGWLRIDAQVGDVGDRHVIAMAQRHVAIASTPNALDVHELARKHEVAIRRCSLSPQTIWNACIGPNYDAYGRPVALAAKVVSTVVSAGQANVRAEALMLQASIIGKVQESWMVCSRSPAPEQWASGLSTRHFDRGRAWPIENWEIFTNPALARPLEIMFANAGTTPIDIELFVFYDGMNSLDACTRAKMYPPR